jgi:hypothetical protein
VPVPIEVPPPVAPAPAPVVAPAPAPAAPVAASVEEKHEVETPSARKPIQVAAEVVLALPEDGIATLVRTSPGLRVHGYYPLRDRVGLAASFDYVRGMNQVDVPGMTAADAFGLAAGARLVLSSSDAHSLYAEGMLGLRHLSVDAPAPSDYSGTGFGLTFGFGADIAIEGKWRATAAVSYTSCGIDVTNMDGVGTTLGVDFLVLGMGAGTAF